MMIVDLILGFLLILSGRNLFWLCVGTVGFLVGVQCAQAVGWAQGWMVLGTALVLGCAGAVLAVSFEWIMVVVGAGFFGGGYILMNILAQAVGPDPYAWLIFVVGGIVGMCLMVIFFDWTLIFVSTLLGALIITNMIQGTEQSREVVFIGCLVTGMTVQYLKYVYRDHRARPLRST